jgi:hypothetical protein
LETLLHSVGFSWLLSLLMWGVDVDGLACHLHHPMACGQMRGQDFLSGVVLSCRVAVGGGTFLRGVKLPSLDI